MKSVKEKLLVILLLFDVSTARQGHSNLKSYGKRTFVPFSDSFDFNDDELDGAFGVHSYMELNSKKDHELHVKPVLTTIFTSPATEIDSKLMTSGIAETIENDLHIPEFHDLCKRIFCRTGRTCKTSSKGKPECVCAEAGSCVGHHKQVCGADGLLYPSHCELHRVACIEKKHIGIDHTGSLCINGIFNKLAVTPAPTPLSTQHFSSLTIASQSKSSVNPPSPILCMEKEYNRLKNNLLHYHCARIGETECFVDHSKKKMIVENMFAYYDSNGDKFLDKSELNGIEHLDHLDRLSRTCHLVDLLKYDDLDHDSANSSISQTELLVAFKVKEPLLDDNLKVFTTFVTTGNSVELKCGIRGLDDVIWKRRGHLINSTINTDVKIMDSHSLYIADLSLHHMGNYTCQGTLNSDIIQTHVLLVQMPPVVSIYPESQFHLSGATAYLKCHLDGVPQPEIYWEKNETPLMTKQQDASQRLVFRHENTSLEIKSVDYYLDTGAYKCIGKNSAGSSYAIANIFIENSNVLWHSFEAKQVELFAIFHDSGYTIYEMNHCHIQHQVAGNFQINTEFDESSTLLCPINESCLWSDAINIRNQFIYVSQPKLHRILVIEVTNRMNPVQIIALESVNPHRLDYIDHLDQVWVTSLKDGDDDDDDVSSSKTFTVINDASKNITHHPVELKSIDTIRNLFLPSNNNLKTMLRYGFVQFDHQMALHKIDLISLTYTSVIDVTGFECLPDAVAFIPIGGYIFVSCAPQPNGTLTLTSAFHLVIDYITDTVLERSGIGGALYLSPDARHLVVAGNRTLSAYTVTADGQIEHVFDKSLPNKLFDLEFFPSNIGSGYDIFAITETDNRIIYFDLRTRKVIFLEDTDGASYIPTSFPLNIRSGIIAGSGNFAEHLMVSSETSVSAIDGQRKRKHCEWQNVDHGYVIVSFVSGHF